MAHYAQINIDNIVTDVIIVADSDAPNETAGQAFIASLGISGQWIETSLDGSYRGKYAAIDDVWNGIDFVTPTREEE